MKENRDICGELDQIEDSIRNLLISKTEESEKRAEPLFTKKNSKSESLKER